MQVLKHWIENSVEDRFAKEAVKILSASKEEILGMVSSNAFIITEMERKAEEKGMVESKREDIIDILSEMGEVPSSIRKVICEQEDIEILRQWLKLAARCNSMSGFKV
jgi:predicted ATP-dependent protease